MRKIEFNKLFQEIVGEKKNDVIPGIGAEMTLVVIILVSCQFQATSVHILVSRYFIGWPLHIVLWCNGPAVRFHRDSDCASVDTGWYSFFWRGGILAHMIFFYFAHFKSGSSHVPRKRYLTSCTLQSSFVWLKMNDFPLGRKKLLVNLGNWKEPFRVSDGHLRTDKYSRSIVFIPDKFIVKYLKIDWLKEVSVRGDIPSIAEDTMESSAGLDGIHNGP